MFKASPSKAMSESITKKKGMKKPSFFGKKGKKPGKGFSLFKKPMVEDTDMDGE